MLFSGSLPLSSFEWAIDYKKIISKDLREHGFAIQDTERTALWVLERCSRKTGELSVARRSFLVAFLTLAVFVTLLISTVFCFIPFILHAMLKPIICN